MVEFLFLDLDDTILDFHKAEHIALAKTLQGFGLEPTADVLNLYSRINKEHWERLERKELTREQVLVGRFEEIFSQTAKCLVFCQIRCVNIDLLSHDCDFRRCAGIIRNQDIRSNHQIINRWI